VEVLVEVLERLRELVLVLGGLAELVRSGTVGWAARLAVAAVAAVRRGHCQRRQSLPHLS
jgi:hypothetical protein